MTVHSSSHMCVGAHGCAGMHRSARRRFDDAVSPMCLKQQDGGSGGTPSCYCGYLMRPAFICTRRQGRANELLRPWLPVRGEKRSQVQTFRLFVFFSRSLRNEIRTIAAAAQRPLPIEARSASPCLSLIGTGFLSPLASLPDL